MAARKNTAREQSAASAPEEVSEILKITQGQFECCLVGTSPLVMNRMSEKAKHELLLPKGRMSEAEKATKLKHRPVEEYRASVYRLSENPHTYLGVMSTAIKGALRAAAVDMPNASKAQIGRLTFIKGDYVGVYGLPQLWMAIVRSADMKKTPDVRSRAILPHWAARVSITFVMPLIRAQAVANLLAAAGITIGIGDGRNEKGALSYGQFRVTDQHDPEFIEIVKEGGRQRQIEALKAPPECYDDETRELLSWYDDELARQKKKGAEKK